MTMAGGAQDFRGQNLQGRTFKNANLMGCDFSGADLRGTRFIACDLRGTNFTGAQLGVRRRWVLLKGMIAFLLSAFFTLWAVGFNWALFDELFVADGVTRISHAISVVLSVGLLFFLLRRYNLGAVAVAGAVAGAVAVAFAAAGVFVAAFAGAVAGAGAGAFAAAFAVTVAFAFAVAGDSNSPLSIIYAVGLQLAWVAVVRRQMRREDERSAPLFAAHAFWEARFGTNFGASDLTDADFSQANCRGGNFRGAKLVRTRWRGVQGLDRAWLPKHYPTAMKLKPLLTSLDGEGQTFDGIDLSGLNLAGANLQDASFVDANLSNCDLQAADLSDANLTRAQLDNANLRGATLTGAFIEDWNLTRATDLTDVHCDYIFMHYPADPSEDNLRKPDDRTSIFAPGDFADFIKPLYDTLDLYHSHNVDTRAIARAFNDIQTAHPDDGLQIVAVERRGAEGVLVRVDTVPTADKSTLSAEYHQNYQEYKLLAERREAELLIRLDEKEKTIAQLMDGMIKMGQVHVNDGSVYVGGDVGGSIVSGDENTLT